MFKVNKNCLEKESLLSGQYVGRGVLVYKILMLLYLNVNILVFELT